MAKFTKLEALLSELYTNRKLFSSLFDKRMGDVSENVIIEHLGNNTDKIHRLEAYGLLSNSNACIGLDSRLQDFFEDFLEVDDSINISAIKESLEDIKENISYLVKENNTNKKDAYLSNIKKRIKRISRICIQNVKTLRNLIDNAYKLETNYELKRDKLNNIRQKRDSLYSSIKSVVKLLNDDIIFRTEADDDMLYLVHSLKLNLQDCSHNLIEIQQQIIEYLNHIETRELIVNKVFRLKMLKDKFLLKDKTDFHLMVSLNKGIPMLKQYNLRSRLSVSDITSSSLLQELIFKVRKRINAHSIAEQNVAGEISKQSLDVNEKVDNVINYYALKNIFRTKNQDLFSFVMQHKFNIEVSEKERIAIFCKLASLYENEFEFTLEQAIFNKMEYAIIKPKAFSGLLEF